MCKAMLTISVLSFPRLFSGFFGYDRFCCLLFPIRFWQYGRISHNPVFLLTLRRDCPPGTPLSFPWTASGFLHLSNIRVAQKLSNQLSSCLFPRCSFSAHFFFLHSFAFIIHCLWSLHKIWGGLGKGFSWRFQAINNLLISAQFVGYDVGYRAVIALISVSFFTVYAANVPCLCLMPCLRLFVNFWQTPFWLHSVICQFVERQLDGILNKYCMYPQ